MRALALSLLKGLERFVEFLACAFDATEGIRLPVIGVVFVILIVSLELDKKREQAQCLDQGLFYEASTDKNVICYDESNVITLIPKGE